MLNDPKKANVISSCQEVGQKRTVKEGLQALKEKRYKKATGKLLKARLKALSNFGLQHANLAADPVLVAGANPINIAVCAPIEVTASNVDNQIPYDAAQNFLSAMIRITRIPANGLAVISPELTSQVLRTEHCQRAELIFTDIRRAECRMKHSFDEDKMKWIITKSKTPTSTETEPQSESITESELENYSETTSQERSEPSTRLRT